MVRISCDSIADLSNVYLGVDLYAENDITVVPQHVRISGKEYYDGIDLKMPELLRMCDETGEAPKTAAPQLAALERTFSELTKDGSEVIHLPIGAEFSVSYSTACIAADSVGNTYVVDSRNLSSGAGLAVLEAVQLAKQGLSGAEIKEILERDIIPKVEASFVLDRLDYMAKGGRCSAVAALGANILSLHPCIEVIDGCMKVVKKYRGSLDRCIRSYVRERLENRTDICLKRAFITYTDVSDDILESVKALIKEYANFDEVIITTAGCAIASHCGHGTLGILFMRK